MNERGTRKSGKDIASPEKKRIATQCMCSLCWRFHPLPLLSPLLCFFSHPIRFRARPTLSRKERFAEFKGNKQVIKRSEAINMYLKSGSWQISDIEINFKSCKGLNLRFSQANDVGKAQVVKYIVVYRHF